MSLSGAEHCGVDELEPIETGLALKSHEEGARAQGFQAADAFHVGVEINAPVVNRYPQAHEIRCLRVTAPPEDRGEVRMTEGRVALVPPNDLRVGMQ
jgi:hypothetical protein